MTRKLILNIAISLDGYIATEDGKFDWIEGHNDSSQNTMEQFDFSNFVKECDYIVMGRKSFEDCGIEHIEDYKNKHFLIAGNNISTKNEYNNLEFVNKDIVEKILSIKQENSGNIWLFGGAETAKDFIKSDIIDEYIIGIIPVILGKGKRLFFDEYPFIHLHLKQCTVNDGIVILHYARRS